MKKLLIMLLILLTIPVANACDASIVTIVQDKTTVEKGKPVTVDVTVKFEVDFGDQSWRYPGTFAPSCDFLTELSLLKPNLILGIPLMATITNRQQLQCCPGNDNFKAEYLTVECEAWELLGCSKTETVRLIVSAPKEGFCDHCSDGAVTPTCSQDPDYYWEGPGYYTLHTAIYNGCYNDVIGQGIDFETYATRQNSIYVSENLINGDGTCGDGICGIGENFFNCSEDCPFEFPIDTTTLIWIGVFAVVVVIIVIAYKTRKK